MLINKRMNRTELKEVAGVSFNVVAELGKGESVSLDSLYRICKALNCDIGDIMEFTDDETEERV
ncbi:MAG: helix-turn-helix transcriptional regulator [Lachnospiraceae bacterium]|nr:helix-turn-helix transcriptional regulator [Lachnospiraceae bacterium]